MKLWTIAALVACTAACGDNLSGPTGGPDGPAGFVEAVPPTAMIPQVIDSGGPTLAAPIVQPIYFASDPDTTVQPYVDAFLPQLATSSYWTTVGEEYGVGPLTIMPSIVSTDTAPANDKDMRTYLGTMLDGTHLGWPMIDNTNTIYMVLLPSKYNFAGACSSFAGYHDENASALAAGFTYAIIANCGASGSASAADEVTVTISHELIEASTDPKVESTPAYISTDTEHLAWAREAGAEVGDMCEWTAEAQQRLVGNYMVQRIWSNASALAGHDGCVPVLPGPYFNAWPNQSDVTVTSTHGNYMTEGYTIAMGQSETMILTLFSDAVAPAWEVSVIDAATLENEPGSFEFLYGPVAAGQNSQQVALSVTRKQPTTSRGNLLFVENRVTDTTTGAVTVPSYWWIYVQ